MQNPTNMRLGLKAGLIGLGMLLGVTSAIAQGNCPDLHITKSVIGPNDTDLGAAIRKEAGPLARAAEWGEVKACYEKYGLRYFRSLGAVKTDPKNELNPFGSQVLVLVNGNRYFQAGQRVNEGTLPFDFLAHDQAGGNQISLGSWFYFLPAFYVLDQQMANPESEIRPRRGRQLKNTRACGSRLFTNWVSHLEQPTSLVASLS